MTTTTQCPGCAAAHFPSALKQARCAAGLSQSWLAAITGYDHSHISRLESGTRNPTRETVLALAAALGCDDLETDELLIAGGFAVESDEMRGMLARAMRDERRRRLKVAEWEKTAL